LGAAIARRLVADGAKVMLHSWSSHDAEQPWGADPGGPEALLEELRVAGGQVDHFAADFADPNTPASVADATHRAFGRLDVVVANHARNSSQSLEQLSAAELDLSHAVNVRATLLLLQAFAARYDGRPGGRIVLFTSGQYHSAMPDELAYIATKADLHELTASLAVHLMPRGITVNCVDPGPNDTGYADTDTGYADTDTGYADTDTGYADTDTGYADTDTGYADTDTVAAVAQRSPGGRWSTPVDTAKLIAWLVSDEADWVTGQTIASDGGWSSR